MRKLFAVIAVLVMAAQLFMISSFIDGSAGADAQAISYTCQCLSTLEATDVGINSATLNGQLGGQEGCLMVMVAIIGGGPGFLAPVGGPVLSDDEEEEAPEFLDCGQVWFAYGTDPGNLNMKTPGVFLTTPGQYSRKIMGLKPCTKYYYRITAESGSCIDGIIKENVSLLPGLDYLAGYEISTYGAGIGLKPIYHPDIIGIDDEEDPPIVCQGGVKSFTTGGCELLDDSDLPGSSGGGTAGTPADQKGLRPYIQMSAIAVKSATISNPSVGPGQPVVVKANVTNSGTGNGVARITVYINGVEESAQPATLTSGQSSTLEFTVTRNEPGTYSVVVNNVPAGSFTVGLFNGNDMLIYGSIALVAIGFGGILYMLTRKRNTA